MSAPSVRVEGLAELRRALRRAENIEDLTELRVGMKRAADVVAQEAQSRVPSRSGRARGSVRAVSGGNRAFVVGGRKTVPYYGWLDFGTRTPRTGNPRSKGPWAGTGSGPTGGRFIYPAIDAKEREVVEITSAAVGRALNRLGL